ncbi:MAG: aminopeptidase [Candidatus Bathyarchaeota archaeon]|nr:aminopeptidase [Candidatus Bathyarchaeota archaeon]
MSWPISYHHYVPAPSSFIEMMRGARKIVEECAGVREGENVVISTDANKMRIAEVLAAAALSAGGVPTVVMIPPSIQGVHGAQPPEPVVAACREADVFLLPTTWSQTHTDARIEAIKHGSRGSTLCEVTEDCLCVGGILADFNECDRIGRKLGALLSKATEVRIRTPLGTDVRGEVSGRPVQYETGLFREPGQFAALPDSEINISPVEGTAEGRAVIDVRIMQVGVTRAEPVTLTIKEGEVKEIKGGATAERFRQILEDLEDETAYNLAEFGIGLNPVCREYATNLEDLGGLGHFHLGIGSSYAIGGKVKAPSHIDAIGRNAVIEFDGRVVFDRGAIKI